MKSTGLILAAISFNDMLTDSNKEYNQSLWEQAVKRVASYKDCRFYVARANEVWGYDRFFTTYEVDGLKLFSSFSAYHTCISNTGFVKVKLMCTEDDMYEVFTEEFTDASGKTGRAANYEGSRNAFVRQGIRVTTAI